MMLAHVSSSPKQTNFFFRRLEGKKKASQGQAFDEAWACKRARSARTRLAYCVLFIKVSSSLSWLIPKSYLGTLIPGLDFSFVQTLSACKYLCSSESVISALFFVCM